MCGIGGILRVWKAEERERALRTPHGESIPEAWLDILDDAVKHRGPDGQGRFRDRALRTDGCVVDVAFVHRRLSIIDHAGGHQPMVLEVPKGAPSASSGGGEGGRPVPGRLLSVEELQAHNRRVLAESHAGTDADPELALGALSGHDRIAVVFNGCIYNHREFRADLQRAGHVFASNHSDTEVLVHGWREWADRVFSRTDGMLAAAVWDGSTGQLVLGRDRAGEKPLYESISRDGQWVAFGSSVASVLLAMLAAGCDEVREVPKDSRWILEDQWIRRGFGERPPTTWVHEVDPGGTRTLAKQGDRAMLDVYVGDALPDRLPGWSPSPQEMEEILERAVESRLEADVPLACFLSGGIDSSLVAIFAQKRLGSLTTFSAKMPDARYDESAWAERVAEIVGTSHQSLDCSPDPRSDLPMLIAQAGVPFGDSSLLPTHWISRAAKEAAKVALGGDGGDELFGGYERYRAAQLLERWGGILRRAPAIGSGKSAKSPRAKFARLLEAARGGGYDELLAIFSRRDHAHLFGRAARDLELRHELDPLRTDFNEYLPQDLLRKTDTATMAVALEYRSPFLASRLVDTCFGLPLSILMPEGQRKGLLRKVARRHLPAEIVDRPKMGFAIPIGEWFRSDYGGLRTMLQDHLNSTEPFGPPSLGIDLNMKFIRQMLDEHLGTGPSGRVTRDHSQRLYMLLVLSIWAKWMGGLK